MKSKYGNIKTEVEGIMFDSKGEAARWTSLRLLEKGGFISKLKPHDPFDIYCGGVRICRYIPDYTYVEAGKCIAEDFKGKETQVFRLKAKLFRANFPNIELRVTKAEGKTKWKRKTRKTKTTKKY